MNELFHNFYQPLLITKSRPVQHDKTKNNRMLYCADFPIMQRIDEQVWNQSKHYLFSLLSIKQAAAEVACHNLCNILCTAF